jgi:hypothetical protein
VSTKLQEGPIVTWLTDGRTSQVGRRSGRGDDQRSRFARPFAASVDLLRRSGHPDLPVHWQEPMKEGSGEWIRPQLPALVAFPVGVEDETSVVDASEQHHSGGRAPIGRGCGNCHRLGHGLASCPRSLEPPGQLGHRIGIDGRFVHGHSLVAAEPVAHITRHIDGSGSTPKVA